MSRMAQNLRYHLLADLSTALEAEGYDLGTGKYLQVQELLQKLPADTPLEQMASLLCPLYARNRQEQEQFYALFRQSLARVNAAAAPAPGARPHEYEMRVWRNILLAMTAAFGFIAGYVFDIEVFQSWRNPTLLLVLSAVLAAGYFVRRTVRSRRKRLIWLLFQLAAILSAVGVKQVVRPAPPLPLGPEFREFTLRPGDTLVQDVRLFPGDSLLYAVLGSGASVGADSLFGTYSIDQKGRFTYIAADTFDNFRDTIPVEAFFTSTRRDTTYFVILLQPGIEDLDLVEASSEIALAIKAPPRPQAIESLLPNAGRVFLIQTYRKFAWVIKIAMLLAASIAYWALLQWRERRRRFLAAVVQERTGPPYTWRPRLEDPPDIAAGDTAPILLNSLRRRIRGDAYRLDIPASVRATIGRMGMATFAYRELTQPPDYLLLIDRQSPNDHRAMLFDWLFRKFREQEAPLVRFFFEGDIRLCFDEENPGGIPLRELQHRYGNARLVVISNGHQFLSPMSGRVERWASMLKDWRRRALLSPTPLRAWGRREERLGDVFYVMPATQQGWGAAIEQLDALDQQSPDDLIRRLDDVPLDPIRIDGDLIPSLQKYFPEPVVEWIAACAVYPLLHWEVTLFLGNELSGGESQLLQFDNLLQMTRLPWFVSGRIPEEARMELLDYLAKRGLEGRVREALHRMLEQSAKPDPASTAFEDYRLNAALNELALATDRRKKWELESELQGYRESGHAMDAVAFRYLKERPSRLTFTLPRWLERMAEPAGALAPATRDKLWITPLFAVFAAFVLFYNPPFDLCSKGEPVLYEGLQMCISNPGERLLYNELLVKGLVEQGDYAAADSLLNRSYELFPGCVSEDTIAFLRNAAVYYYNKGVGESVRLQVDSAYQLDSEPAWPESMCKWFLHAYTLDAKAGGIADPDLLAAAGRCVVRPTVIPQDLTVPMDELKPVVISGRVVDAATKRGLGGVAIGAGEFKAVSDRSGNYALEFPGAAAGRALMVQFSRQGFQPLKMTFQVEPGYRPAVAELLPASDAQAKLRVFRKGEFMGLQDARGNVVLAPEYHAIEYDAGGNWYRVERRLRSGPVFGFADAGGNFAIPVNYRELGLLKDGLVRANTDAGWGYLNRNGQLVIPFRYEYATDFSGGSAEVGILRDKQRIRFTIDKSGNCTANCPSEPATPSDRAPTRLSFSGELTLYFDENEPVASAAAYDDLYSAYYAKLVLYGRHTTNIQQQSNIGGDGGVAAFFESELKGGKEELERRLNELSEILQAGLAPGEQIVISIAGFSDSREKDTQALARRRAGSVEAWILRVNNRAFTGHRDSGRLRIVTEGRGDQGIRGKEPSEWLRDARQRRATVLVSVQTARK